MKIIYKFISFIFFHFVNFCIHFPIIYFTNPLLYYILINWKNFVEPHRRKQ